MEYFDKIKTHIKWNIAIYESRRHAHLTIKQTNSISKSRTKLTSCK